MRKPQEPQHPSWHIVRPDADKLIRAVLDALTGKVWRDDCQVAELLIRKRYADDGKEGVMIKLACDNQQVQLPI
jgi:Holliday junction resolvase RusA-like endonuclease